MLAQYLPKARSVFRLWLRDAVASDPRRQILSKRLPICGGGAADVLIWHRQAVKHASKLGEALKQLRRYRKHNKIITVGELKGREYSILYLYKFTVILYFCLKQHATIIVYLYQTVVQQGNFVSRRINDDQVSQETMMFTQQ